MDNWLCVHCNIILPLTYQHTHLIAFTIVSQITFSILANTILQFGQSHFVTIVTPYSHTDKHTHSTPLCGSLKHVSASTSSRLASLFQQQQQKNLFLRIFFLSRYLLWVTNVKKCEATSIWDKEKNNVYVNRTHSFI